MSLTLKRKDEMSGFKLSCLFGYVEIVQYWLEKGVDVDEVDDQIKVTPLYISSGEGYLEVVMLLVSYGADITKSAMDGTTPIYVATDSNHLNVVKFLMENEKGCATVNQTDNFGRTLLFISAEKGFIDIVRLLVDHG